MGLLKGLILLPLAPVRGVVWVADRLAQQADRELHDPARIRAELEELSEAFEDGLIGAEEFEVAEAELLERLDVAREWPQEVSDGA